MAYAPSWAAVLMGQGSRPWRTSCFTCKKNWYLKEKQEREINDLFHYCDLKLQTLKPVAFNENVANICSFVRGLLREQGLFKHTAEAIRVVTKERRVSSSTSWIAPQLQDSLAVCLEWLFHVTTRLLNGKSETKKYLYLIRWIWMLHTSYSYHSPHCHCCYHYDMFSLEWIYYNTHSICYVFPHESKIMDTGQKHHYNSISPRIY